MSMEGISKKLSNKEIEKTKQDNIKYPYRKPFCLVCINSLKNIAFINLSLIFFLYLFFNTYIYFFYD